MEIITNKKMAALASSFVAIILMATTPMTAEALEPTLLWKKEFKHKIDNVDLASDTGDVILNLDKKEVLLFDKNGNQKFHWGPRIDRFAGEASISGNGAYFAFWTDYSQKYMREKKLSKSDNRIHFYSKKANQELWNYKTFGSPKISPDGTCLIVDKSGETEIGGYQILNAEGKKTYEYQSQTWGAASYAFSPDSNYFAVVEDYASPLMLFQKNGTKLWEKGKHNKVASISEYASYISTYPFVDVIKPENSTKGTLFDRTGNLVLEGFGILSGNGGKFAMYSPDKISVLSLTEKTTKEIPIHTILPRVTDPFFAAFSYDGRYLIVRSGKSLSVFDLTEDTRKEITISGLGKFPTILITRDGKYLVVRPEESAYKKSIYYYQLY